MLYIRVITRIKADIRYKHVYCAEPQQINSHPTPSESNSNGLGIASTCLFYLGAWTGNYPVSSGRKRSVEQVQTQTVIHPVLYI